MEISRDKMIVFLTHIAVTFIAFYICVSDSFAGLGLLVFGAIQLVFSLILCKNKKYAAVLCGCAFALCAASFLGAPNILALFNYAVIIMLLALNIFLSSGEKTFLSLARSPIEPFFYIAAPFRFLSQFFGGKKRAFINVLISVVIIVPCLILVLALLASSDPVFLRGINSSVYRFFTNINGFTLVRIWFSLLVTIYLFGAFFATCMPRKQEDAAEKKTLSSQIPTVLTALLLVIYAVFSVLQFKYLFFGAKLPAGITHAEYARRGFFELLVVSAVNLAVILSGFKMSGGKCASVLRYILCGMTAFLIFCSFWRMLLYYRMHGLTELRLYVFIFLLFEFAGLIITVLFLIRQNFSILRSYFSLALVFWLIINLINVPALTAKSHIDAYLSGKKADLDYVFSLSYDAADEIFRLTGESGSVGEQVRGYFSSEYLIGEDFSWQSSNLSIIRYKKLAGKIQLGPLTART